MSGLLGARTCSRPGEASDLKSPLSAKLREPLTEARFQQLFGDAEQERELLAEPRWSELCRRWKRRTRACSGPGAWRLLLARLPPLRWLPRYRWRAWLLGDAVAGVTVGIVHVPQGMAFALLTSVPPVFGLYTSFFPVLIYTLLGTGRHLSTGTFAVLSLMTGSAVEQLVPEPLGGNLSVTEREQLDAQRVQAAAALAFGSGALMLGMFALQLGVLSTFLSEPVVKALTSGTALHVLVSQLPSLLGLPLPRQIGCFALFKTLAAVLTALPRSNPAELTISALSLALLVPVKELNVLLASVLCFTSSLDERYNVQIVGLLPGGFPQPLFPNLAELPRVLDDSLPIALVTFAVSASLASIYADKHSYTIDANQELLAHGASNLISSLFSCFPNSASLATTSLLVDAGGNTQLAGLFSCVVVLSVLLWLGPFFYYLPKVRSRESVGVAGRAVIFQDIGVASLCPLSQGCPGLHQHLQHAPDVLPDAGTSTTMAHQPYGFCCVDGHMAGCSDPECGPGPGRRCGLLHDDCGLPHPEVGVEMRRAEMREGRQRSAWGDFAAGPGWGSDPSFLSRVQCVALGLAEGTELYRPLKESPKLLQVPGLCILSYPTPLYFGTRGEFRRMLEWHLGLRRGKKTPKTDGPPDAVAEPVRAVVLDCGGITFADAAGAREVVQLASRCQDAGIHLLLAQCHGESLSAGDTDPGRTPGQSDPRAAVCERPGCSCLCPGKTGARWSEDLHGMGLTQLFGVWRAQQCVCEEGLAPEPPCLM
ncbi:solute carrier family 26 member 10 isoform X2 [Phyllostomus discolor]|uniref:Solute carrier family 26 member 10 isoform X2 n=1 Tax=Phyllostomus discolor TaxID=89673 RepID=A0A7E6D5T9_9CHIR|nr:solute carrier family 26 member 10 isoform X2 [Phyllostomus discolor]